MIDLDKPFHVDDTFHLEMARWIADHPTAPLSGRIDWGEGLVPMHVANQPPGFFYLIACTGALFGYGEVPMHLMRSLFTLLAIVCCFRLAQRSHASHALTLTALLALGPAFLVNQGVMVDMPLLALHLLFFDLLLRAPGTHRRRRVALAALVLGVAMLVKYTTLPLLFLFPVALLLRKETRLLGWCAVPFAIVLLWSAWNMAEFGFAHVLSRTPSAFGWLPPLKRFGALLTCVGAIAPFTPLFLAGVLPAWRVKIIRLYPFVFVGMALLALLVWSGVVPEDISDKLLFGLFLINGAALLVIAGAAAGSSGGPDRSQRTILLLWLAVIGIFVVLFAPTMGTKHVLLILPPLLLLCAPLLDGLPVRAGRVAVIMTAMLGMALTISDKAHARFFRNGAIAAARGYRGQQPMWSAGLWGFKWYAREEGMLIYPEDDRAPRPIAVGDVLVKAEGIHAPSLLPGTELQELERWNEPRPWWTFLYVGDFGSMYTADFGRLPWRFDREARNSVIVYRVTAAP